MLNISSQCIQHTSEAKHYDDNLQNNSTIYTTNEGGGES